ncbi:1-acyl-sn-glycerol-3-phosphate acyltransferase [Treponema rectale]|nr:lysophospholipid acyltransferase family protein [Treponema rectale]MBB5217755.1 1-acyl-sn-glycerol-3-phosphate acyltransferase [Treponema rectale]
MTLREHIVAPGTYIPELKIAYPARPDESMRNPEKVNDIDIENDFDFLQKSFSRRIWKAVIYAGIFFLVFPLSKILYGIKISGRENIRKNKRLLKNGAMTVCNHVHRWDFPFVLQAVRWRRMWFPAKASNIQTKDANLILGAGGIPIPQTMAAVRKFNEAFNYIHAKKRWIHVFPESCRWAFYEPIRPFRAGAFKMALRYSLPVIPVAISYRPVTGWRKFLGIKHPLINVRVGSVIFPQDIKGESKKERCALLRDEAHRQVVSLAGIEQNKWPSAYDDE